MTTLSEQFTAPEFDTDFGGAFNDAGRLVTPGTLAFDHQQALATIARKDALIDRLRAAMAEQAADHSVTLRRAAAAESRAAGLGLLLDAARDVEAELRETLATRDAQLAALHRKVGEARADVTRARAERDHERFMRGVRAGEPADLEPEMDLVLPPCADAA